MAVSERVSRMPAKMPRKGVNSKGTGDSESENKIYQQFIILKFLFIFIETKGLQKTFFST